MRGDGTFEAIEAKLNEMAERLDAIPKIIARLAMLAEARRAAEDEPKLGDRELSDRLAGLRKQAAFGETPTNTDAFVIEPEAITASEPTTHPHIWRFDEDFYCEACGHPWGGEGPLAPCARSAPMPWSDAVWHRLPLALRKEYWRETEYGVSEVTIGWYEKAREALRAEVRREHSQVSGQASDADLGDPVSAEVAANRHAAPEARGMAAGGTRAQWPENIADVERAVFHSINRTIDQQNDRCRRTLEARSRAENRHDTPIERLTVEWRLTPVPGELREIAAGVPSLFRTQDEATARALAGERKHRFARPITEIAAMAPFDHPGQLLPGKPAKLPGKLPDPLS